MCQRAIELAHGEWGGHDVILQKLQGMLDGKDVSG